MEKKLALIPVFLFIFLLSISIASAATLELSKGWNLVSSPIEEGITKTELDSKCNLEKVNMWKFDAEQGYIATERIDPGQGVWIKLKESCTFTKTGSAVTTSPTLKKGWNLISASGKLADAKGECVVLEKVWKFDTTKGYVEVDYVTADEGIWVKVEADCTFGKAQFALPDLVITEITVESPGFEQVTANKNTIAKVTVKNNGDAAAGLGEDAICTMLKKDDGTEIFEMCVGETIGAGKTLLFDFSLHPFQYEGGNHTVTAIADSTDTQIESDETNNEYTKSFQVYT